jgi:hypothetical protein
MVRLTNVGEATLQIKKISASSEDIQVGGVLLPVVVAHGTSETFTISYRAQAESRMEGEIRIFTTSRDEPLVLKVKASVEVAQTELTASEASINFDDVAVGSSSRKEVSLTNAGNSALKISGMVVSGANFSLSGAGAVNLSPGQNITLEVNFAPRETGRQRGSLVVLNAKGESLVEIPLVATGAPLSQIGVKLNWEESPASVAGYVIYRSLEPSGPYTRISSSAVASSEYVDTGLAAGHTYYYVVTAVDADEVETEYSTPISATVPGA